MPHPKAPERGVNRGVKGAQEVRNLPMPVKKPQGIISTKRCSGSKIPRLRADNQRTEKSEIGPAAKVPIKVPTRGGKPDSKPMAPVEKR